MALATKYIIYLVSLIVSLLDVVVPDQPGGQAVWQQGRPDLLRTLLRCAVCYAVRRLRRCLQSWYDVDSVKKSTMKKNLNYEIYKISFAKSNTKMVFSYKRKCVNVQEYKNNI